MPPRWHNMTDRGGAKPCDRRTVEGKGRLPLRPARVLPWGTLSTKSSSSVSVALSRRRPTKDDGRVARRPCVGVVRTDMVEGGAD